MHRLKICYFRTIEICKYNYVSKHVKCVGVAGYLRSRVEVKTALNKPSGYTNFDKKNENIQWII